MIPAAAAWIADRLEAPLPLSRQAGYRKQACPDRGVPGDVAAALHDLAEDHVVDLGRVKPRPLDGLGDHRRGELDRGRLCQTSLEGRADGGAARGDDDGFGHNGVPLLVCGRPL